MAMRRSAVPIAFLVAALAACRSAESAPANLSDQDVSALKGMVDRWVVDFTTNKRDDLANMLTADIILMPPNMAPLVGRDASMSYMKAYPPITKFTATKDEVVGHGDVAYIRGTYALDATMPDKTTMHDSGTYLEIHRKQADGSWPYSRLMWHSSLPAPAPAPAPTKK